MSYKDKLEKAKQARSYTAEDETVFTLGPVKAFDAIMSMKGVFRPIVMEIVETQNMDDPNERMEKVKSIMDKTGGPETISALQDADTMTLCLGIKGPFKVKMLDQECEDNEIYVTQFKELYPNDWGNILEKIQELSGTKPLVMTPDEAHNFQDDGNTIAPLGEGVRNESLNISATV